MWLKNWSRYSFVCTMMCAIRNMTREREHKNCWRWTTSTQKCSKAIRRGRFQNWPLVSASYSSFCIEKYKHVFHREFADELSKNQIVFIDSLRIWILSQPPVPIFGRKEDASERWKMMIFSCSLPKLWVDVIPWILPRKWWHCYDHCNICGRLQVRILLPFPWSQENCIAHYYMQ